MPVVISSRKPGPLVIPLADATGKKFRQGPGAVRIEKVAREGGRTTTVNFFVSEEASPVVRTRVSAGPEPDYLGDFLRDRVEFQDAEGHPLNWQVIGEPWASRTGGELRVQTYVSGVGPPARMLVYRLHRLATEIPFEFDNVPSP